MTTGIPLGSPTSLHTFDAFELKWLRQPKANIGWSTKYLHEQLHFDHFNGRPWRWWCSGYPAWRRIMTGCGLPNHVLGSSSMKVTARVV